MKKSRTEQGTEEERYRGIFERASVSLWEEDISKLRSRLAQMKAQAGFELRAYLAAHPEFLQEAVGLIEVTDVNPATVRLFEAESREELLGPLHFELDPLTTQGIRGTVLAIDEGRSDIESELTMVTRTGKQLSLIVQSHIPPAHAAHPSMIVSLIDITARKLAEQRERRSANILRNIIESYPDPLFVKDASLRMVLCNSAHSRSVGMEPSATYGRTDIENGWDAELVLGNPAKNIPGWQKDDLAALDGATVRVPAVPSNVGDEIRYFDALRMPLRDEEGTVTGIIGIGRDITERKRAEEELREAKEFAENLINTANVMIVGLDTEGRVTIFNQAAEAVTGYSRSEILGRKWFETVVPQACYPDVWPQFQNVLKEGDTGSFKNPILTKSGQERLITWRNSVIRSGGSMKGTLSFGIDATERLRAEKDLAWERKLFTMLMDHLPVYIYFKDRESRFIRTSRSHARALGLSDPAEALGKTDADFYAPDHAGKALEDEMTVIRTGKPLVDIEERETYPDRPDAWVITTKMPLRDEAGEIVGTFGITHDITKRKHLEEHNQALVTLVEAAEDAIVGLDLNRRITVWNKGAERIYGYSADEMIGTATSRLIPPELEEEARLMRERIQRGEALEHFETTRLRRDGSRIDVSLTLSAIRDEAGRIVGMASVARDITKQKALQEQLGRVQRLETVAMLAGGIAHRFNNIAMAVTGYLDMVKSCAGLPLSVAAHLEGVSKGVQKMVEIIDRLQSLTGHRGSAIALRLEDLAAGLLPWFEKRIKEEGIEVVDELAESAAVLVEEPRMKLVLSSLISNALDSLLDRPVKRIRLTTGSSGNEAWFQVEDTGCGVSAEDLPRLFSPFFSRKGEWALPGSPQSKLKGVGLDLAIGTTTVSEYGGRIEVQSTAGVGSTFRVVMPIRQGSP